MSDGLEIGSELGKYDGLCDGRLVAIALEVKLGSVVGLADGSALGLTVGL